MSSIHAIYSDVLFPGYDPVKLILFNMRLKDIDFSETPISNHRDINIVTQLVSESMIGRLYSFWKSKFDYTEKTMQEYVNNAINTAADIKTLLDMIYLEIQKDIVTYLLTLSD